MHFYEKENIIGYINCFFLKDYLRIFAFIVYWKTCRKVSRDIMIRRHHDPLYSLTASCIRTTNFSPWTKEKKTFFELLLLNRRLLLGFHFLTIQMIWMVLGQCFEKNLLTICDFSMTKSIQIVVVI